MRLRFEPGDQATKYDDWAFFREEFRHVAGGSHGVDCVCISGEACWLIEIKALARRVGEDSGLKIADTIRRAAEQVRDTLAGLAAARVLATGAEEQFARAVFDVPNWRVALHLEQTDVTSRLHRTPYDPTDVTQKLRQQVRAVDAQAVVVDSSRAANPSNAAVPWRASTDPASDRRRHE